MQVNNIFKEAPPKQIEGKPSKDSNEKSSASSLSFAVILLILSRIFWNIYNKFPIFTCK